jgi:CspA family cold shock protein
MPRGTVKWFDSKKGFGFVLTEDGATLFVHYTALPGSGRRSLVKGQAVEFEVAVGDRGPCASNVRVLPPTSDNPQSS